jgi:hypothetical protein
MVLVQAIRAPVKEEHVSDPKRVVECRLIVIAFVDLTSPALSEAVMYLPDAASIAVVVASEIRSNLESVGYIDTAVVTSL